jgi:Bromodomain
VSGARGQLNEVFVEVLDRVLENHIVSGDFRTAVDTNVFPDYPTIVTTPMDLAQMRRKAKAMGYDFLEDFVADARLIRDNCTSYCAERYPTLPPRADVLVSTIENHLKARKDEIKALIDEISASGETPSSSSTPGTAHLFAEDGAEFEAAAEAAAAFPFAPPPDSGVSGAEFADVSATDVAFVDDVADPLAALEPGVQFNSGDALSMAAMLDDGGMLHGGADLHSPGLASPGNPSGGDLGSPFGGNFG